MNNRSYRGDSARIGGCGAERLHFKAAQIFFPLFLPLFFAGLVGSLSTICQQPGQHAASTVCVN